jgi:hypothetical protein
MKIFGVVAASALVAGVLWAQTRGWWIGVVDSDG